MSPQPLVFLAHASEDKELVRGLHERLLRAGARPWLDELDLLPGQDWQLEITNALSRAEFVVACISKNSVGKTGFVCVHRAISNTDSGASRTLIPTEAEHRFRAGRTA